MIKQLVLIFYGHLHRINIHLGQYCISIGELNRRNGVKNQHQLYIFPVVQWNIAFMNAFGYDFELIQLNLTCMYQFVAG